MRHLSQPPDRRREMQYLARFAAVGLLGTLLDVGLFALLHGLAGLAILPANTLSYSAGIVNNFVLNRRWTYGDLPQRALGRQLLQFALVSLSALLLNNLVLVLLTPPLSATAIGTGGGYLLAKFSATVIGLGWSFVLNRVWTFKHEPEKCDG